MGNLRVIQLTNTDERFYPLLGPFLSRREIVAELGGPIYDDAGKVWFVAMSGKKVAGFAAVQDGHFCSDYVLKDHRKKRVHDRLMTERIKSLKGAATATVTPAAKAAYERHGFKAGKAKGKYTQMRREPS